jgi:hypothetical protein
MLKAHLREQNCFQTNRIMNKQYLSTPKLACESDHERKQNFLLFGRTSETIYLSTAPQYDSDPPPSPPTHTHPFAVTPLACFRWLCVDTLSHHSWGGGSATAAAVAAVTTAATNRMYASLQHSGRGSMHCPL